MESSPLGDYKAVLVPPCCLRNVYGLISSATEPGLLVLYALSQVFSIHLNPNTSINPWEWHRPTPLPGLPRKKLHP